MAGTVERAFQLAPECETLDQLRGKLIMEGHLGVDAHLLSGSLGKQLKKLLRRRPV